MSEEIKPYVYDGKQWMFDPFRFPRLRIRVNGEEVEPGAVVLTMKDGYIFSATLRGEPVADGTLIEVDEVYDGKLSLLPVSEAG